MRSRFICCVTIGLFALPTHGSAQARFTVDDLLKIQRVSDPQVSPDGRHVAYVVTDVNQAENTRNNDIWIVPVEGGTPVRLTSSAASDDHPRWSPDGRQLAFVSSRDGGSQIYVLPVSMSGAAPQADAANPKQLTSIETEASGGEWSPDGKWVAFLSEVFPDCDSLACNAKRLKDREQRKLKARLLDRLMFRHWTTWKDDRFSHLFIVPVDGSAAPRDLTPGEADVPPFSLGGPPDYAFAPDSREIAFVRKTDPVEAISTNSDVFVVALDKSDTPRKITSNPAADGGPVYSPDGKFLLYRAQSRPGAESDRWQLMLYERESRNIRSLTARFDRSPDDYVWAADSSAVFLVAEDRGLSPIYRMGLDGEEPRAIVTGGSHQELRVARDGRTLVFGRSSLHAPVEIFRADASGAKVTAVTSINDRLLAPFKLRQAESVTYQGAGGTPNQAWIVKPASFEKGRRYPLLFLVHGGPQSSWADAWSYRWNAQVLANDGYVVFLPNPRGSTSFGQQFIDEITGDWAGKVYEDLMKGADYAELLPYVERGRTGAAGASYGGYMMNWFLGHTDRFKAIVSHAGVFNLTSMYGVTEELWFPEWEFGGTPWTNPEMYETWSPHRYAKNFKTPTLVSHGELDFRVPIGEGFQLYTTLQRLRVPSRMLYFPDEGHWIGRPQNSALWYRTFLEWMDRYVRNPATTSER